MTSTPEIAQASRQPMPSISASVIGMKIVVPRGRPTVAMASARPRLTWNHFATGTVVSSWPAGAPKPAEAGDRERDRRPKAVHAGQSQDGEAGEQPGDRAEDTRAEAVEQDAEDGAQRRRRRRGAR